MIAPPTTLRLSAQERAWLVSLKAKTSAMTYAVLCRFALVASLGEPRAPFVQPLPGDGLEIDWHTLGGRYAEIYWACVIERTRQHGLAVEEAPRQLRAHLHRGIGLLKTDRRLVDSTGPLRLAIEVAP